MNYYHPLVFNGFDFDTVRKLELRRYCSVETFQRCLQPFQITSELFNRQTDSRMSD